MLRIAGNLRTAIVCEISQKTKEICFLRFQLFKDGFPERVCDYCHLQLNTFHAFVKKAKTTSIQFDSILHEIEVKLDEQEEDVAAKSTKNGSASNSAASDFDSSSMQPQEDIGDSSESVRSNNEGQEEMDFIIGDETVELTGNLDDTEDSNSLKLKV